MNIDVVVAILTLVSAFATGAIAFVFRYGTRLAVAESRINDLRDLDRKHEALDSRVVVVEEAVKEFKKVSSELGRLPAIEQHMSQIVELLKGQVPRNEMDVRFAEVARRLEALETPRQQN